LRVLRKRAEFDAIKLMQTSVRPAPACEPFQESTNGGGNNGTYRRVDGRDRNMPSRNA
jgi:hypothetical protein